MRLRTIAFLIALLMGSGCAPQAPDACATLAELALPGATITSAQTIAPGGFDPPALGGFTGDALARLRGTFAELPRFCRIAATLRPSSDSDIGIEVWMPTHEWNGKFLGVGNGGWAGRIEYGALGDPLLRGFAVASTDTGHRSADRSDASFAWGHPEKLIDFGYRAVHEMTVVAKQLVEAFYEQPPHKSYWTGCSTGGRQGLAEAQRFPQDYDGIVAGAPANYWTHLMAGLLWATHATMIEPASALESDDLELLNDAAIGACDALDGVEDGLLEDPTRCAFDPVVLQCEDSGAARCLTEPQVAAARKIYAPSANPRTGEVIAPGFARGSERGWVAAMGGPGPSRIADDHFKYAVFADPDWDFRTFDFDRDVALADSLDAGTVNAIDPDLTPFVEAGGKLILFHGWNDPLITPFNTIDYYQSVVATMGAEGTDTALRLFMAPGVNHCGGGAGPGVVDWLPALERWVEDGVPPDRIVASSVRDGAVVRTRPLCPYPQVARYRGAGSADDADSFVCAQPGEAR